MPRLLLVLSLLLVFRLQTLTAQEKGESQSNNSFLPDAEIQLKKALQPPKGELFQFAIEHQLKGTYVFDLTIRKKVEVATVFIVSSENASISMQNLLKDRLKSFRFNLTLPKGQSFKFQYTFNFP